MANKNTRQLKKMAAKAAKHLKGTGRTAEITFFYETIHKGHSTNPKKHVVSLEERTHGPTAFKKHYANQSEGERQMRIRRYREMQNPRPHQQKQHR